MGFFIAGYILDQLDNGSVQGIDIIEFPDDGLLLQFDLPPRHYELTNQNAAKYFYGTQSGQGGLVSRYFDPERTDPELLHGGLADSFVAKSERPIGLAQTELAFHLDPATLFPFLLTPETEKTAREDGRLERYAHHYDRPLKSGIWYPIELSSVEIPSGPMRRFYPRPGIAAGVFKLAADLVEGRGVATVRFVYEEPLWDPGANTFHLYRFGRPIGSAHLL